ncbi:hypothetical protein ACFSTC_05100 [Nonomuraea ferruginea]
MVWVVPGSAPASTDPDVTAEPGVTDGRLQQAYRLTVEKQGDKWYVDDIRGAGRVVG